MNEIDRQIWVAAYASAFVRLTSELLPSETARLMAVKVAWDAVDSLSRLCAAHPKHVDNGIPTYTETK